MVASIVNTLEFVEIRRLPYINMAGESEAAEPKLPFDWRQIEDEDELSFGSELASESEGDVEVDTSAPQSRQQVVDVDVAAKSTAPAEQRGASFL